MPNPKACSALASAKGPTVPVAAVAASAGAARRHLAPGVVDRRALLHRETRDRC